MLRLRIGSNHRKSSTGHLHLFLVFLAEMIQFCCLTVQYISLGVLPRDKFFFFFFYVLYNLDQIVISFFPLFFDESQFFTWKCAFGWNFCWVRFNERTPMIFFFWNSTEFDFLNKNNALNEQLTANGVIDSTVQCQRNLAFQLVSNNNICITVSC